MKVHNEELHINICSMFTINEHKKVTESQRKNGSSLTQNYKTHFAHLNISVKNPVIH